jgi:hypothetical protein
MRRHNNDNIPRRRIAAAIETPIATLLFVLEAEEGVLRRAAVVLRVESVQLGQSVVLVLFLIIVLAVSMHFVMLVSVQFKMVLLFVVRTVYTTESSDELLLDLELLLLLLLPLLGFFTSSRWNTSGSLTSSCSSK